MADYYFTRGGQRFGPVSPDQLKAMAAAGSLLLDDMIWKEGMATPVAAARLKGLFPVAALNPQPQPVAAPEHPDEFRVQQLPPPQSPPAHEIPVAQPAAYSSSIDDDSQADIMARKAKDAALAASSDALKAFKIMAADPVGGLKSAYESLGAARAMAVGIVFGVVFTLCLVIGGRLAVGSMFSVAGRGFPDEHAGFPFMGYVRLLLCGVLALAVVVGGSAALRATFKSPGHVLGDIFLTGAAMLPLGLAFFLAGILGVMNAEVSFAIILFAFSTTVLMLYSGFTSLNTVPSTAATVAVPVILILSAYACKIIMAM